MKCQSRCIKRMQFYAVLSNACEFLGRHLLVTQEVDFRMTEKQQKAKKLDRPQQKFCNQKTIQCSFFRLNVVIEPFENQPQL